MNGKLLEVYITGIVRTLPNIYDEAECRWPALAVLYLHRNTPPYIFQRVLNAPLNSNSYSNGNLVYTI